MKDIEKLLQTTGNKYTKVPICVEQKIQYALNNVDNKRNKQGIKQLIKFLIGMIITMISTSGICWATVQIYNEYIKKQEAIVTRGLFDTGDGISDIEIDLRQNDMIWDDKNELYYKVIRNNNDYIKYKERVTSLPEINFETNFLLIITWQTERELHETDLKVNDIVSDENTTYITLKQKEEPNYETENNLMYAVISNQELRENVVLQVENYQIINSEYIEIEKLPQDYSIENAIKDGCVVLENNILKSNNLNLINNFVKKSENGENCFIRVYRKEDYEIRKSTFVSDVEYKDGIYYVHSKEITGQNSEESFNSYEKIVTRNNDVGNYYYYWVSKKKDMEEISYKMIPFIIIRGY